MNRSASSALLQNGPFYISTDKRWIDEDMVFFYLSKQSYWARGIARETVHKSVIHTPLCFGVYLGVPGNAESRQVGFARVISDLATFAYLADVFILDTYQGEGLGKWLIDTIIRHPDLQGLRRFILATRDAHSLYGGFGFAPLAAPEKMMERLSANLSIPST
ncbi:GNAT family N-acetyltransferase [Aneurinibacillus migulanus]|uniref:Acetyltransferase (GNAT) family protein n=1 Tax=Aneurinibacillus migulanus TaxID=47500 RepID=A0A1G8GSX2_ANEMI|nr:GNAT family N-acetyltransferase [Aneurinibacillus migulanus]MED0891134.1 GNAT family N-acetyltransferase [Aneurinibacillus migulanus]MED1614178.1 GNAT family N-acetyltransferase [Aneurinibacillus migulanus]GED12890.1 N-acetyltransferase [Aneurinibacillus migulanus]SDH97469.1 Acetyltransferase (GNAT) family protein [Aneurinibacillus migulanus]